VFALVMLLVAWRRSPRQQPALPDPGGDGVHAAGLRVDQRLSLRGSSWTSCCPSSHGAPHAGRTGLRPQLEALAAVVSIHLSGSEESFLTTLYFWRFRRRGAGRDGRGLLPQAGIYRRADSCRYPLSVRLCRAPGSGDPAPRRAGLSLHRFPTWLRDLLAAVRGDMETQFAAAVTTSIAYGPTRRSRARGTWIGRPPRKWARFRSGIRREQERLIEIFLD